MKEVTNLTVKYHDRIVGMLAETRDGRGAFQYADEWLAHGFAISPFSLPLEDKVFVPKGYELEGLFGVFADSLPDGWGRLLVDWMLREKKIAPSAVGAVTRLGIVGMGGMGALEYYPELWTQSPVETVDFDELSRQCSRILQEKECEDLDTLFALGASSGGARPKALIAEQGTSWIVKFPGAYDRDTIGQEEYAYMQCAAHCGIRVPECKLFPSDRTAGYFGVRRFDRENSEKKHMVTVSGLLETSHRIPNLDYTDLMKLTAILTKDQRQIEELYRRMCFNVFAHNRDDHSRNFTFLYEEETEQWTLSSAYDLTYSNSIGGEHATTVNGNGYNPGMTEVTEVGRMAGLPAKKAKTVATEIREIVDADLGEILASYR